MSVFIERLNAALEKRNITPAQLARIMGVNEGTISNYRKGRYEPKQRRLEQIADALDVQIAWLLGADVPMQKEKSPAELTEGEKAVLELFRKIPKDKQDLALEMLRAALQAK